MQAPRFGTYLAWTVMEYQLRAASVLDAGEIARLSGQLGYPSTSNDIAVRLRALLANPLYCTWVADAGNGLLGWVAAERRLALESGMKYEIVGLVVDSAARRLGVGQGLVEAAECWAAQQGASHIHVRSNVLRQESHGFYQSLGYARSKTQHSYVRGLITDS